MGHFEGSLTKETNIKATKEQKGYKYGNKREINKVYSLIGTHIHMYTLVFRGSLNDLLRGRRNSRTAATRSLPLFLGRHRYSRLIWDRGGSLLFQANGTSRGNCGNSLIRSEKTLVDIGPTQLIHKGPWIVVSGESRTLERGTKN